MTYSVYETGAISEAAEIIEDLMEHGIPFVYRFNVQHIITEIGESGSECNFDASRQINPSRVRDLLKTLAQEAML